MLRALTPDVVTAELWRQNLLALAPQASSEARELLAGVPALAPLSGGDLLDLMQSTRERSYAKGQVVFHRDDRGDSLHIIEKGQVRVFLPSPEGEEMTVAVFGSGDFFGELCLLDVGHAQPP